jgi:hypothetical protein
MEIKYKINIANDFSKFPAGRYRTEGNASGEAFLTDHLIGTLLACLIENVKVEINLTGMNGYPSSFISGSVGKISHELGKRIGQKEASILLKKHIEFVCDDSLTRKLAFEKEIESPITPRK